MRHYSELGETTGKKWDGGKIKACNHGSEGKLKPWLIKWVNKKIKKAIEDRIQIQPR